MFSNPLKKTHLTTLGLAAATTLIASAGINSTPAEAATSCKLTNDTLQVTMTEHRDSAAFTPALGTIAIGDSKGPLTCSGGTPTVNNINSILIVDNSTDPRTREVFDGSTRVSINEPGNFKPGKSNQAFGEIRWYTDMKNGRDELTIGSNYQAFAWKFGNEGVNWSFDNDADMIGMPFDDIRVFGGTQQDSISLQGGDGTGAPLSTPQYIKVQTGQGPDSVQGSDMPAGDDLDLGDGDDFVNGFGGPDNIRAYSGNDTVKGGAGNDVINYKNGPAAGVTVDLGQTGPQDTGEGRDTISEVETVVGTTLADTLIGGAGADVLDGDAGDDTLDGRGGADTIRGRGGIDTASFANAPGAVTADLSTGRATQGADSDGLILVENVVGSRFADTLTGDALANRLVGGPGTDTVNAGAGADRVEIRDGEADTANCGADADTAITDRRTLDAAVTDCETVDALPEPGTGQPRVEPLPTDSVVRPSLTGASVQRLVKQKSVRVLVGCGAEPCSTVASGTGKGITLKPIVTRLPAGAKRTVKWRLTKAQLATVRTALAKGKRPALRVSVQAQDAAGNKATRTLRITAKA
jgi:hypothetical protein